MLIMARALMTLLLMPVLGACSESGGSPDDARDGEAGEWEAAPEPADDGQEAPDEIGGVPDMGAEEPAAEPDAADAPDLHDEDGEPATEPEFPIVFIHGHAGGLGDWRDTIQWLVDSDPRWSAFLESGTRDWEAWEPASIPPGSRLFNFTYYNLRSADAAGDYTAGPGTTGSNGLSWCTRYDGWGHLPADSSRYYSGVDHEYAADLNLFIDRVLEATGAARVDLVAHSMGGLVSRSFIQFFRGFERVRTLILVSSPIHGLSLADLSILDPTRPDWMQDHEFAELDDIVSFWDIGFRNCHLPDSPVIAWHTGLNATDDEAAGFVAYHVVVGGHDPYLDPGDVAYDHAPDPVVLPGADHTTVRNDPALRLMIAETLGN